MFFFSPVRSCELLLKFKHAQCVSIFGVSCLKLFFLDKNSV